MDVKFTIGFFSVMTIAILIIAYQNIQIESNNNDK